MEASGSNNISGTTEFNSIIMDTTSKGNTPLHLAYFFDKRDVVKLLLGLGANACTLNKDGLKPFEVTRFRKRKVTSQIQFSPKKRCKKKGRNERFICTVKSIDTENESTSWERYALYLNSIFKEHDISVQTFEDFVFSSVLSNLACRKSRKCDRTSECFYLAIPGVLSPMNKYRSQKTAIILQNE